MVAVVARGAVGEHNGRGEAGHAPLARRRVSKLCAVR